jgi:hypothetical protein
MTRAEVKNRINHIIDKLPDKTLESMYEIFRNAESDQQFDLKANLNKVLMEDATLLQKLAK